MALWERLTSPFFILIVFIIKKMREYHDLSIYYPENVTFGNYSITKEINNVSVANNLIDHYDGQGYLRLFNYNFFLKRDELYCVMDSGPFELMTNSYFLNNANGDIIIFGLGLGMIIFPLLNDPSITSITVIENNQDIIDYVGNIISQYDVNNKVTIILGDVNTYYQNNTGSYDFIYFDYWDFLNEDSYNEMGVNIARYDGFKKNKNSTIFCWCQDIKTLIINK